MRKYASLLFVASALLISACSDDGEDTHIQDVGESDVYLFGSMTDALKAELPLVPVKTIDELGEWPSDITISSDYAFVVSSGKNVIHRINLETLEVERNYIDLGQGAAPYSAEADEDALYVALQGNPSVIKYPHSNPKDSTVILKDLVAPTAVYLRDGNIYATDSEYDYGDASKTGGKLYSILKDKAETVVVDTTVQNPGFLEYCPMYNLIITVDSGVVTFGQETKAPEKSCVDMWKIEDLSTDGQIKPMYTFCKENVTLGRTFKSNGVLFVGDGLKPQVHAINMVDVPGGNAEFETIKLSDDATGLTTPVDVGNQLVVVDYNNDRLYWFDGKKVKTSYRLSASKSAQRGPIDAVYDAYRKQLLILNSASGSVDVLKKQ
ncbi:MAG: hypothetical protein IJU23_00965 [Proteobacteria bacterium]|nr:hypothetical protein [Pseudomonadota bacterium]